MTQAGGPAAINGFLYQIIHHLGWLAEFIVTGKLDGVEITDACLVLEPRSGGDARAETSGLYLVEQYKTREGGTWTLADLEAVLRDLRKAVPSSCPESARYRFVTDGRAGRLDTFNSFLDNIKAVASPDDLDTAEKRNFGRDVLVTNREFFDHIVAATRSGMIPSTADERAVVFHLLFRFEMEFASSGSARAVAVERLLRRYAPDLGDEAKVRERLVGVLVERLSEGETRFDAAAIDQLFRYVGLNPERPRKLAQLAETMNALTRRRFARLRYQAERDVRGVPEWPEDKQVLVIEGESGAGKTWQLGRFLEACAQERQITTFVSAARTREDLLTQASRDVWQTGLGETSDKSLVAVSHFLRELEPDSSTSRLIVALDDVQDIDLARDLVRQDWMDWGMRLVLTVPRGVARSLAMTDGSTIHVHSVNGFSIDEVDTLLKRRGQRWADLPSDLKKLLCNPILAGLYAELPHVSFESAPRREYEIFESFWQRITAKGQLGDKGIVLALASHMREGKTYPLPRSMWHEIGLDNPETLSRLEASGWLRSSEIGEAAFAHDRLLNWAIAKSLVWQFRRKRLSLDVLADILTRETGEQAWYVSQRLAYVLMDAIWLLTADESNKEALGQLIARLENNREFGSYGEDLYVDLLPTLGQRAIPLLCERLNTITSGSDGDYRVGLIGKAFAKLTQQENVELEDAICSLLNAPSRDLQKVAIAALTAAPDARHLDRLWELHKKCLDALVDKADGSRHVDYKDSFAALRAGVELDPAWLRARILETDAEKECASELGYLLNGLEHPDAPAIWEETADALMDKIATSNARSLLHCIERFSDREKLDFVVKHLSSREDFANGAALTALTVLDPIGAINRLVDVEDSVRYVTRNHWLPVLLRAQRELTCQRIRELAESDRKGHRKVVDLFWERPDDMDEASLRFVLRSFQADLHDRLDEAVAGDPIWLDQPLDFLKRVARPDLLKIVKAEAGGELERMITVVACSRLRTNSNYVDRVRESARSVLILMGGQGIATLVEKELESEHFWIRVSGLKWAFIRNTDGIVERLVSIARHPVSRDNNGKLECEPYGQFHQAITALAALGPDTVLVDTLWEVNIAELPLNLPELRAYRGPLPKALTEKARCIIQCAAPAEDSLLMALAVAALSCDADLIPSVRSVLEPADPQGLVARFACIALQHLGDKSDEFARLAWRLAETGWNSTCGLNALVSLGERGLHFLGKWLQKRQASKDSVDDEFAIRALYSNPATRRLAVDAAVDRCLHVRFLLDVPYDIAAEAVEPTVRGQILDKAFASQSFTPTVTFRAIRGLAKFDTMRAVEAIELGLLSHQTIDYQLCRLLVRIAPEIAAVKLIEAAISIDRQSLRRAVGRALRRLDPELVSPHLVERMSGSTSERKTSIELAGWLPIPQMTKALGSVADMDTAMDVRLTALNSLYLHRREACVRELLTAFASESYDRRWTVFVKILEVGDPYLLTDREDPLWLGRILTDEVPAMFDHYANSVLRLRKQEVK